MSKLHSQVVIGDNLQRILFVEQFKMPHSRRLCWCEHDVLSWVDSHRPDPQPLRRPRGRPTKAAQLARLRHEELTQKGR